MSSTLPGFDLLNKNAVIESSVLSEYISPKFNPEIISSLLNQKHAKSYKGYGEISDREIYKKSVPDLEEFLQIPQDNELPVS